MCPRKPEPAGNPPPSPPAALKNLGPRSREWLAAIGIYTRDDLTAMGVVSAYCLMKENRFPVTINLLYAMQAALFDVHWTRLPRPLKAQLQRQVAARLADRPPVKCWPPSG